MHISVWFNLSAEGLIFAIIYVIFVLLLIPSNFFWKFYTVSYRKCGLECHDIHNKSIKFKSNLSGWQLD